MRFVNGLKSLFKKPLLTIIFFAFLCSWVLFFVTFTNPDLKLGNHIALINGILAAFTFVILVLTVFIPIEKIGIILVVISAILVVPLFLLFKDYIDYLYLFCFFANQVITAFFAFKFCMDTSIAVDHGLYKTKNKTTYRIIEFISFLVLSIVLILFAAQFMLEITPNIIPKFRNLIVHAYRILFWGLIVLLFIVLVTLIILQKFAAYTPLFYIFVILYISYIILNIWAEFRYINNTTYDTVAFIIDLLLFFYIIGSILDRVDYIHDHLKIIRADTIAVFFILMKMLVQIINIRLEAIIIEQPDEYLEQVVGQAVGLYWYFIAITFIFGIFYILIYKHKKKFKKND